MENGEEKKANSQFPIPNSSGQLKVALVCDWLLGTGGAERVVLELHRMFPNAPIYTSQYDKNPKIWFGDKWFKDADVRTTWLQKLPKSLKKFLPVLRAWTFSRLDLSGYDLVISSSGAEAKAVKTGSATTHVCYCLAPTHYYWSRYNEYLENPGFGVFNWLARLGLKVLVGPMRRWDYKAAQRPDFIIGISGHIKNEIKKYYGREAEVIHPPVNIELFKKSALGGSSIVRKGFITAGRQTPYKRIDLAVRAATKMNVPLAVIGRGPDHKRLKRLAGRSVTFLANVSDEEMPEKFAQAEAFIFPCTDDFGIVAVEALAAGTPVIAYRAGGALDYINKSTGLFFKEQTVESLAKVMREFSKHPFNHVNIAKHTEKFSPANFRVNIQASINKLMVG